ncbi:MAG: cupin domain-containing protein [Defluviitaleaceae bacterium]|nr:cupin domain-containing protein [Defluviitaleaceae bacterium]
MEIIEIYKDLLRQAHVIIPKKAEIKLYHHYGAENVRETGALFITVVQHDYCKYIVCMTPGQTYPMHYHRIKDESFYVLHGDLSVVLEDEFHLITPGEILNVPRRFTHGFSTKTGCVFEELSTAYLLNDSVYQDKYIRNISGSDKMTYISIHENK